MKTCNAWSGFSIASDSRDETRKNARSYLRSKGGRYNYLWLFQNLRDGIEDRITLAALEAEAFKQRNIEAREPNWNRIQVMRRLYKHLRSKCSESYVPEVTLAGGFIEFQPLAVREDLESGAHILVIPQARRTGIEMQAALPMMFYCARNYLLSDTREQLLPATPEERIGIEIPDLGNSSPTDLRFLREAQIYAEGNAKKIEPDRVEQRLAHFQEVWPDEVKHRLEELEERRRELRKRKDPWPKGSLFNPDD
ncbi:MAG: hypothetical protein Q8K93_19170 [Reyranella sp.]|nr:hypothetical protein [Reyranella sp.]